VNGFDASLQLKHGKHCDHCVKLGLEYIHSEIECADEPWHTLIEHLLCTLEMVSGSTTCEQTEMLVEAAINPVRLSGILEGDTNNPADAGNNEVKE